MLIAGNGIGLAGNNVKNFGSASISGLLTLPEPSRGGVSGVQDGQVMLASWATAALWRKRGAAAIGAGTAFRNRSPGVVTVTKKRLPMSFKALVTDSPITASDTATADDTPNWNTAQFKIAMLLSVTD